MMRSLVFTALLVPGMAMAAPAERYTPTDMLFAQNDSIRELQRQRMDPANPPGVQRQRRDAAEVDGASVDDAASQLNGALTAIRSSRYGAANEFLERAESRLLTRGTLATEAGDPVRDGAIGRIAAARAALLRNDKATGLREVEAALVALDRPRSRMPR
ncbi:MAG: hypothetical protein JWR10_1569 [Rubritepida sp.]|nr:hypothetical protein [Rubritepida sp.]